MSVCPTLKYEIWWITYNEKIQQLCKDPELAGEVECQRLRWTGHLSEIKNSIFKNIKARLKAKDKPEDPTENGGTKSRRILGRWG